MWMFLKSTGAALRVTKVRGAFKELQPTLASVKVEATTQHRRKNKNSPKKKNAQ